MPVLPAARHRARWIAIAPTVSALVATCLAAACLAVPAEAAPRGESVPVPVISPTPQSMREVGDDIRMPDRVGIVAGADADPAALRVVRQVLAKHGITAEQGGSAPVKLYVGGPAQTAQPLAALGVDGPDPDHHQGYVLATGHTPDGARSIVLAGADAAGTFYAAQTFRQLVVNDGGAVRVPGTVVRDWPAYEFRGGMESYYGPLWSYEDQLDQIDFLAEHKMDTFFYGPADDHRTGPLWREPYGADELARLQALARHARDQHVNVIYRISPESPIDPAKGICHSSTDERTKLVSRLEQLWGIGIRQFSIAWDDVPGGFVCEQDKQVYAGSPSPLATAQAEVVNDLQAFVDTHPGALPILAVPTEYFGNDGTAYRSTFDLLLTPKALVYWTGPQVVSPTITPADLEAAQRAFPRHQLVLWDNYPVNDMLPTRLFLGPVTGRSADLAGRVRGITFNEMPEQAPSQISLFTAADYAWNPSAYDPDASWDRGLRELGRQVYPALRTFAENNHRTLLDGRESLTLAPLLDELRKAYAAYGDMPAAARPAAKEFARMAAAPEVLRDRLDRPLFITGADPWLTKLQLLGQAGEQAARTLGAQADGDLGTAWRNRFPLGPLAARLKGIPQVVADGIGEPFLDFALANDPWFGARWYGGVARVSGGPAPATGAPLDAVADGNLETAYRAASAPDKAESLTVTLDRARPLSRLDVLQDPSRPAKATVDGLAGGVWTRLGVVAGGASSIRGATVAVSAVRLTWATGSPAPAISEIIPVYADALPAALSVGDHRQCPVSPGSSVELPVTFEANAPGVVSGTLSAAAPEGWTITPPSEPVELRSEGRTVRAVKTFTVEVPANAAPGRYLISFGAVAPDGRTARPSSASVTVAEQDTTRGPYADGVIADRPAGYWRLDDTTGTAACDSAIDGHDGRYQGVVERAVGGALAGPANANAAVRLTGGYVNVPANPGLQITGPFTLEAWVKPDGVATDPGQAIIERYDQPANNGYIARLVGGNRVQAWVLGAGGANLVTGGTSLTAGTWHHVAVVYDGSRLTVYVDGAPDGAVHTTVTPGAGSGDLRIGARGDDANQRFAGGVDEAAVYRHALTPAQVQAHHNAGTTG